MYRDVSRHAAARLFILVPLLLGGLRAQPPGAAARIAEPAASAANAKDPVIERLLKKIEEMEVAQKQYAGEARQAHCGTGCRARR